VDACDENAMPTPASESSLAKAWLTPEEDAAWADLQEAVFQSKRPLP
jgi:hypothetical protein